MKTHKWQLEIRKRHLRVLLLDLGLIIMVLGFTSYVIVKQVIVEDLHTDLLTMKRLSSDESSFHSYVAHNQTRYIAAYRNHSFLKSPDFNITERLRLKVLDPTVSNGTGVGLINGYPKIYVLYTDQDLTILMARRASQNWFYVFVLFLVCFLFIFFHIQRLVGYRFLFTPALTKVQFYEELNEAKETFFAGIFHELGTPLTSLMSRLEILMEQAKNSETRKSLENAYLEAQRISFLSTEQLHRARFEMGLAILNLEEIYPMDLLDSMSFRLEILLEHHAKVLTIETEGHEVSFMGDRLKLEQALINLITNAIKYDPKGSEIYLRVIQRDEQTILEVQDEGEGIDPELVSELLQPFHMGERKAKKMASNGLGLFLVNNIALAHGGSVVFDQRASGFAVQVRIPQKITQSKSLK